MNIKLLNDMFAFTQYIAACASTSSYESDIIAEIRKLQPQIKAALAAPTVSSSAAPSLSASAERGVDYIMAAVQCFADDWAAQGNSFGKRVEALNTLSRIRRMLEDDAAKLAAALATPAASPVELTDEEIAEVITAAKIHCVHPEAETTRDIARAIQRHLAGDTAAQGGK